MQRKKIDRDEFEAIREVLTGRIETPGTVTWIEGRHEDHGTVFLTRQDGRFWCDADDMSLVRAKGESQQDG